MKKEKEGWYGRKREREVSEQEGRKREIEATKRFRR